MFTNIKETLCGCSCFVVLFYICTQVEPNNIKSINEKVQEEFYSNKTSDYEFVLEKIYSVNREKNNDRYEFDFIDNFGNHAFGYLVFISPNMIDFYIDCSKFSDEGKNLGRLYGNKYLLVKTPYIIDPEDLVTK